MIDRRITRFLVAAFLLVPSFAQAQTKTDLKGKVVEMGSARPLVGAEVALPDLDKWALTNQDGDFKITGLVPGRYRLEVYHLGYRKHEGSIDVRESGETRLELWPDPIVLEGLTAQVDRLRSRRNAIATTVRVADRGRLTGAINIEDAIRRTGEMLVPCGSVDYCLWRRGRVVAPVVYIDERRAFGLDELRAYPVENFQIIEVIGHSMIRAYTVGFMERLALGKAFLMPVLY